MGNFGWEVDFITAIQSAASPALIRFMEIVSMLGEETVLVLTVGLLYWCIDKSLGRKLALGMIFSLLGGESKTVTVSYLTAENPANKKFKPTVTVEQLR